MDLLLRRIADNAQTRSLMSVEIEEKFRVLNKN